MYYTQDEYTSDCNLIPHYTDTTDGITFVSFTSATHDSASITIVQQDGRITVSTKTTTDCDNTQFSFIVSYIQITKILNVLYNVCIMFHHSCM